VEIAAPDFIAAACWRFHVQIAAAAAAAAYCTSTAHGFVLAKFAIAFL
jgi:hypothetical protein